MTDELARRLRRLEDAECARNHLHAYASTLDDPTPEAVAALFTEDGTLRVPTGTFTGREQIAGYYRDRLAAAPERRHFVMNLCTRHLGPGLVEIASYFLFTGRDDQRSEFGWGTYLDQIRVVDGVPLFADKVITPHLLTDLATGWPRP